MLFVLSAPVRFHAQAVGSCVAKSIPRLSSKTKTLVSELRTLGTNQIKKQLQVNDQQAKQYEKNLSNLESSHPMPACTLFDSPFYRALDMAHFDADDASWAQTYVRILSGFYGVLRPYDEIHAGSLPVTLGTKLTTSKGAHLLNFWKEPVLDELRDALQSCPMPVVINCSSGKDSELLLDMPEGTVIKDVEFRLRDSKLQNEALGEFVRWALERRCMTIEELLDFRGYVEESDPATFRVSTKHSSESTLVFEEAARNEGGWREKFADSGMSKSKFIGSETMGSKKYLRKELKGALQKGRGKQPRPTPIY